MAERSTRRALVLNADYRPLSTWPLSLISAQDAIKAVYRDSVSVVEEWPEVFRSSSCTIAIPKVVALRQYAPIQATPKFCRRSILLRDRFSCQYCGKPFPSEELTFDHVIPRARGGQTTWNNILSCCVQCNLGKRDSMPSKSGRKARPGNYRPLKEPRQPSTAELLRNGLEHLEPTLRGDYGTWLYWDVELSD